VSAAAASTVNTLRTRDGVITLGSESAEAFTVRVQSSEQWDTVAVRCAPDTSVLALKNAALEAFGQEIHPAEDFVLKLRGFEVLDEHAPVSVAGARAGSTFLLAYRRRRPVR
jgi:hypothetical protein